MLRVPFALTRRVNNEDALRRLRVSGPDNARTWTFDLVVNYRDAGSGDSPVSNYSAAVVLLPWRVEGQIALARRGSLRHAQLLEAPDVEAGTAELMRRFLVRAIPAETAGQVLDERACDWLTGAGSGFHYEVVHDRVLAYGWRRYLGGHGPLKAARGLAASLSR